MLRITWQPLTLSTEESLSITDHRECKFLSYKHHAISWRATESDAQEVPAIQVIVETMLSEASHDWKGPTKLTSGTLGKVAPCSPVDTPCARRLPKINDLLILQ
jgi:hypothetical protein